MSDIPTLFQKLVDHFCEKNAKRLGELTYIFHSRMAMPWNMQNKKSSAIISGGDDNSHELMLVSQRWQSGR